MRIWIYIGFLAIMASCAGIKSTSSTGNEGPYILEIDGKKISTEEFKYVYSKNNSRQDNIYTDSSIREYLDLFTKFKLKVLEAEAMGLDTMPSFVNELNSYRSQLARPYLTEEYVIDSLVKEAYNRKKEEINVSHILIMAKPGIPPKDTLEAYNKIRDIQKQINEGADFGELAKKYSDDTYSAKLGGNLGYFSALTMVYPFENVAYQTPKGEVSDIFKTRFGYHILKVNDKRPAQGRVKVSHIMVKMDAGMTAADSAEARAKINEIAQKVEQGEEWDELVVKFSEDEGSVNQKGELPEFGINEIVREFEDAAFTLTEPGQISEPIQTPYGWHIIKLIERKPLGSFEELEGDLKKKVRKDSRSQLMDTYFYKRLKKENNFKENEGVLKEVLASADSNVNNWKPTEKLSKKVLFTINGEKYSVSDFHTYASKFSAFDPNNPTPPEEILRDKYQKFVQLSLRTYEQEHLPEKYEDFRMLLEEYREGILLFNLMDKKVWSMASNDTAGLKAFFEENNAKYQWDERAVATIIQGADEKLIQEVKTSIQDWKEDSMVILPHPIIDPLVFDANSSQLILEKNINQLDAIVAAHKRDRELLIQLSSTHARREKPSIAIARQKAVKQYLAKENVDTSAIVMGEVKQGSERTVTTQVVGSRLEHIQRAYNEKEKSPLAISIKTGKFEQDDLDIFSDGAVEWKPGEYMVDQKDGKALVLIEDMEAPRQKRLNEVRGLAISDYQNYLEKQWVKELMDKYTVKVNEEEVQKLIQ